MQTWSQRKKQHSHIKTPKYFHSWSNHFWKPIAKYSVKVSIFWYGVESFEFLLQLLRRNLTQCSTSILYRNLFRPSENLVMRFVRTFFQVLALAILFSYHSAAAPRSKKENSAFFLKVYFASSPASPGASPRAKLIFRSIGWKNDSVSWSGSVPKIFRWPGQDKQGGLQPWCFS